jgi:translocation and assembly module TamB
MTDESNPAEPAAAIAALPPAPRRRRAWRWVAGGPVVLVLLIGGAIGTAGWAVRSEAGSAWLLTLVPGLKVDHPQGALVGDFGAATVELRLPGSALLRIDNLAWRNLRIERAPVGVLLRISIDRLQATRLQWKGEPSASQAPSAPPTDLRLPVEIEVASLQVGEIRFGTADATPVRDLQGALHLGAEAGAAHRIDRLSLGFGQVRASGSVRIATAAPLQLDGRIDLMQDAAAPDLAWQASANAAGPLSAPLVQAIVRAPASAGRSAQTLDLRATLQPFAAWPLGDLQLAAQALDLSAFNAALPVTALSGTASAQTHGIDRPSVVSAQFTNANAGLWNEGRLPLRSLGLELRARPDDLRTLDLQSFRAELGSADRAAGRVEGRGRWAPERWEVDATLADVQPALLDARAPVMALSGPVSFQAAGSGGATGIIFPIDVRGTLQGRLADRGPARAVELNLDASAGPQRIAVRKAEARGGGGLAALEGTASRAAADAPWRLEGRLTLVDFNPVRWWPGRDDSPWRKGPHRLNAKGSFDLAVPASVGSLPFHEALAAVRGQAAVSVADSLLAGVPLHGEATWRNRDGAAALAAVALDAAGNTLKLDGRIGLDREGSGDAWDAAVAAPALNRLAPLWHLMQAPSGASNTTTLTSAPNGALSANAHVAGRWPALTTRGRLEATDLHFGALRAQAAHARWQLGTRPEAPVDVEASLTQGALGGPSVDSLRFRLDGTAKAHAIDLRLESRALPPAWTDTLQAALQAQSAAATARAAGGARSVGVLQARGGLIGSAHDGVSGWRGTVQQVELRHGAEGAPTWLRARDIGIETHWAGGPARVLLEPGRAEVLGAGLRWSRFSWQAAAGPQAPMRLDVLAELDPLRVAPLLARFQPDFGWGGDLMVAGHIDVRSAPAVRADVVFERQAGDLSVTDETGTQALGLTDLRLGLSAADGVWNFTQALAGKTLGVAAGAIVAHTAPGTTWPTAATPIEGVVELQVANLGTWGPWIPAGWRLGGELHTSASIGGRFGAPEVTGEIVGRDLSVRNFLQGVAIGDGDVAIALQGATARIERFSVHAGSGSLALEGNATLGETPQASLKLSATRFQVLGRVDRRIVASGEAHLRLDRDVAALDGAFTVDEGLVDFSRSDAPSLSDDVQVIRRKPGATPPVDSAPSGPATQRTAADGATAPAGAAPLSSRGVALDLHVGLGEHLRIRGRGLDSGLRGELRITSPARRRAGNGTVYTADGTYAAYGQKLAIDRGQLTFTGAVENPRLDIEATRPNLDIRVGVVVTGTALNPRVRLFSEPDLSEMDKLSWLVLGRASDGLGRTDTALLQRAALALLSGEGSGVTDQFTKALGLDEVSVRQTEGEVRETIVSLGKQLSRRWYLGYERGLNATVGSWQLIYRIARRFTLRAQAGQDNAVDVIWTWRWQ